MRPFRIRRATIRLLAISACLAWGPVSLLHAAQSPDTSAQQWPQWRGPRATGVAPHGDPPIQWSEEKNVRWKVELPGLGHSTPVVWQDTIVLTTAVPVGDKLPPRYSQAPGAHDNLPVTQRQRFDAIALNRRDGSIRWRVQLAELLPHEGGHVSASLASPSPITDGSHIWVSFGSYGVYCLTMDGRLKWKIDLGDLNTKHGHGEGSTPVLADGTLVVNWDHEGQSFLVALDAAGGKERWRRSRREVTSWSSPIIVSVDGQRQVIVPGTDRVRAYDLATGNTIWECGGMSANIVASPVAANGLVYVGSSYEKRALLAIRLAGAQGDITDTAHVVWNRFRGTPYVPSLLLYEDILYFLTHYQGILSRIHGPSGKDAPGAMRLGPLRNIYASPVAAAGRVYVTDLEGRTVVLSHDETPRALALNQLDDEFAASAAIVGNELFLRGKTFLYCLANEE